MFEQIIKEMSDEELKMAFEELKEWMETGVLTEDGLVRSVRSKHRNESGNDIPLKVVETAILYEIGERF